MDTPTPNQDPNNQTPPADPTPPSNTDQSQSFDSTARNELFLNALREERQKSQEAERRLAEMQERLNAQQNNNQGNPWDRFTDNPQELIRAEVERSVRPINEFVQQYARREKLSQLKQPFYADPIYKEVMDKAGMIVDQALEGLQNPTVQSVQSTLDIIYAQGLRGNIPGVKFSFGTPNPTPTPPPTQTPRVVPPHNSPATSPISRGPNVEDDKPWERLNESEKLLARSNGMSHKEFWEYMQNDVMTVSTQQKKA